MGFIGSNWLRVQGFKESTNSRVKVMELSTIKTKLASTAVPELGTAQPQLVSFLGGHHLYMNFCVSVFPCVYKVFSEIPLGWS